MSFDLIMNVLEALYYLSGLALAIIAGIGLKQLALLKQDMDIRNQRASKEGSIRFIDHYYKTFIPKWDGWVSKLEANNIPLYEGTYEHQPTPDPAECKKRLQELGWHEALNELETVAAGVNSGLADDDLAYEVIGRSFCNGVASFWDILEYIRSVDSKRYTATVKTFNRWASRMNRESLLQQQSQINAAVAKFPDDKIKPIGTP